MTGPNQLGRRPERVPGRAEMLTVHDGERTEAGAREAIRVGVQYIAAWIGGRGAVPLYGLMEDAATAEICRTLLWQWRKFEAPLADGRAFDDALFTTLFAEEVSKLDGLSNLTEAARLFYTLVRGVRLEEFLTVPALPLLEQATRA